MVLTAVSWSMFLPESWEQPTVKKMRLTSSELAIDAALELTMASTTAILDAGVVREGLEAFSSFLRHDWRGQRFAGRSGAALEALSTNCVTLSGDPL
jgi:hypothetical protein